MPRPRLTKEPCSSHNIYMTDKLHKELCLRANAAGMSLSALVREALREYLFEHRDDVVDDLF